MRLRPRWFEMSLGGIYRIRRRCRQLSPGDMVYMLLIRRSCHKSLRHMDCIARPTARMKMFPHCMGYRQHRLGLKYPQDTGRTLQPSVLGCIPVDKVYSERRTRLVHSRALHMLHMPHYSWLHAVGCVCQPDTQRNNSCSRIRPCTALVDTRGSLVTLSNRGIWCM